MFFPSLSVCGTLHNCSLIYYHIFLFMVWTSHFSYDSNSNSNSMPKIPPPGGVWQSNVQPYSWIAKSQKDWFQLIQDLKTIDYLLLHRNKAEEVHVGVMAPQKDVHLLSPSPLLSHVELLRVIWRVYISHSSCTCWITRSHVLRGLRGLGLAHARPPRRSPIRVGLGGAQRKLWAPMTTFFEEFSWNWLRMSCCNPNG